MKLLYSINTISHLTTFSSLKAIFVDNFMCFIFSGTTFLLHCTLVSCQKVVEVLQAVTKFEARRNVSPWLFSHSYRNLAILVVRVFFAVRLREKNCSLFFWSLNHVTLKAFCSLIYGKSFIFQASNFNSHDEKLIFVGGLNWNGFEQNLVFR